MADVVPDTKALALGLARLLRDAGHLTVAEVRRLDEADDITIVGLRLLALVMRDRLGVPGDRIAAVVEEARKVTTGAPAAVVSSIEDVFAPTTEYVRLPPESEMLMRLDQLSLTPAARARWAPWISDTVSRVAAAVGTGGAVTYRDRALLLKAIETVTGRRE